MKKVYKTFYDLVTNPIFVTTSLVILIFFVHPKHNSSRVHSSFFSTAGGLISPFEFENMMGVVLLRLALLDREAGKAVESSVLLRLMLLEREAWLEGVGM